MSILKNVLVAFTGNHFAQVLLGKVVLASQFLMGICSGSGVGSSGERAALDLVRQDYDPPYCIFDVGSNQGQYLDLLLSSFPDHSLNVHCFEPSSYSFGILKSKSENLDLKERRIVVNLNNLALGKERDELTLFYDKPGSGLASLTKRRLDHFDIIYNNSESVKVDTVDNYCNKHRIDQIHLLKLDVEGHEMDVLAGGSQMFNNKAIFMVVFEFGGCNIDTRTFFQDFFYFFKEMQYKIFRITPSGYLYSINSYDEIFEQFRTTNFVAMRNG